MLIAYILVSQKLPTSALCLDLGEAFDRVFADQECVSSLRAAGRPGLIKLLREVRSGDTVHVRDLICLGRDTLDVEQTMRRLHEAGVVVEIASLPTGLNAGENALATLAQLATLELSKIRRRVKAVGQHSLLNVGDQRKLGRPTAADRAELVAWRQENGATIRDTASAFGLSVATVKRYCASEQADQKPSRALPIGQGVRRSQ